LTVEEYLSGIAQQIVHELEPILKVKEVTINSALLGSYTEAAVRRLIQRVVAPMHVSTGAVIDYPMPDQLRQIDVIVCEPFPAPAVFEGGEFALVPRSSAFGIMEIKRSNYSDIDHELEEFATDAPKIAATPHPDVGDTRPPGMALCVYSTEKPSTRLAKLLGDNTAVAIFHKKTKDSPEATVRAADVLKLINFLPYVGWRYRMQAIQPGYPQLKEPGEKPMADTPRT